jgi:hypothetical protein
VGRAQGESQDGENAEERPIFDVFHDFMFVVLVMFVVLATE